MEVNIRNPIGHMTEFIFSGDQIRLMTSLFNKLAVEVDNNKQLGYASKRRLNVDERDLFADMRDKIVSVNKYIEGNNEKP